MDPEPPSTRAGVSKEVMEEIARQGRSEADARASGQPAAPVAAPRPVATGSPREEPTARPGGNPPACVIAFNFGTQLTADDLARLSPEQIKALFEAVGTVMALTGKS
jgi:hypothetical protein